MTCDHCHEPIKGGAARVTVNAAGQKRKAYHIACYVVLVGCALAIPMEVAQ